MARIAGARRSVPADCARGCPAAALCAVASQKEWMAEDMSFVRRECQAQNARQIARIKNRPHDQ
ncbi:hypothetical protein FZ025_10675 [Xanthomonas hyacinthi]|uniref:hypothetical protein n=1 Tax=Xanthomonas hyacinthi TaxID=56455 RepID=UPI000A7809FE|nr:hypothetical protein [Xanthomonas hyacinthi]QGY77080.1 hypothetical protein FZ025_10675 [Xanthomonas hyacinthi]